MTKEKRQAEPVESITINCLQTLKVYCDPLRARIMQELAQDPRTVRQIADSLGVPFTRLYYHVKMMERHNLIRVVDVVKLPGAVEEKHYQISARRFRVDRSLLTFDPTPNDRIEAVVASDTCPCPPEARGTIQTETVNLGGSEADWGALLAHMLQVHMTEAQAEEFQRELAELLIKYQNGGIAPDCPSYAYLIELYRGSTRYDMVDDSAYMESEQPLKGRD